MCYNQVASVIALAYQLSDLAQDDVDLETRLANVRTIVHDLPDTNFDLLRRIIEHLEK